MGNAWIIDLKKNTVRHANGLTVRFYVDAVPDAGFEIAGRPVGPMPLHVPYEDIQRLINEAGDAYLNALLR
jgi:hypothetical protein